MKKINVITDYGELDVNQIIQFEELNKVKFPDTYVSLICKYNGLSFIESWFEYINTDGRIDEASFSFLTYGNHVGASLIESSQDFDIYCNKKIINFGFIGNGDYVAFDYRENLEVRNPPIVLVCHDSFFQDENGDTKMKIIKIANNFDDFLGMLHE